MTIYGLICRFKFILMKKKFQSIGRLSYIFDPLQIDNPSSISIGIGSYIAAKSWLMGGVSNNTTLKIGNNVSIGHFCHIIGCFDVTIENDVLFADKVFVTDNTHCFKNPKIPIKDQKIEKIGNVKIGEGSWICENVCILGVSVGKHSVIGANSVVTTDIPDYSVAVGIPARVIKKYNFDTKEWESV